MKLLSKLEIQQKKTSDRKVEIDEGRKLAKSIDNLRELRSLEEQNLEAFRNKTVSAIRSEIKDLSSERDALRTEVSKLTSDRKEALKPVDEEWEAVREKTSQVGAKLSELSDRESRLEERENQVSGKEAFTKREFERADAASLHASQLLEIADIKEKDVSKRLASAKETEKSAVRFKNESVKLLVERENAVALRESSVALKEANTNEELVNTAKEWRLLEDRKALFDRNKKRLCP